MKIKLLVLLNIFLMVTVHGICQVQDTMIFQQVLEKKIVDSVFVFGKWANEGETEETRLTYLGQVTTNDGKILKVMNQMYFWGLSQHATSNILIFNDSNRIIGDYHVNSIPDLPEKLENGILVFINKEEGCNHQITNVSLLNGIPESIFIPYRGDSGDLYNFIKNTDNKSR